MRDSLPEIWGKTLGEIRKHIGEQRFHLWFKNTRLLFLNDRELEIGVPNVFVRSWIEDNFVKEITTCVEHVVGLTPRVRFKVDGKLFEETHRVQTRHGNAPNAAAPSASSQQNNACPDVRADLTLNDFVVGPSNQLAYAMAMEVVRTQGRAFNPLFIHGPVGVGKTHILRGIYNAFRKRPRSGIRALYVSAECYTNEYIRAVMTRRFETFRRKYRNINILLIDDVHFLARKKATQEEFLHTFNDLTVANGCVVLASDSHPKMIAKLKESLVSRFVSGMVAKLDAPDMDTRVAIVQKRLRGHFESVPQEVVNYVAEFSSGNVRELEGAVTALVAFARLMDQPLSLVTAQEALKSLVCERHKSITLQQIEDIVCKQFCVSKSDLRSSKRTRAVSFPRQICMHLGRQLTPCSFQEIGDHFGGKNHTTVRSADSKIAQQTKKDPQLRELVASLTAALTQ